MRAALVPAGTAGASTADDVVAVVYTTEAACKQVTAVVYDGMLVVTTETSTVDPTTAPSATARPKPALADEVPPTADDTKPCLVSAALAGASRLLITDGTEVLCSLVIATAAGGIDCAPVFPPALAVSVGAPPPLLVDLVAVEDCPARSFALPSFCTLGGRTPLMYALSASRNSWAGTKVQKSVHGNVTVHFLWPKHSGCGSQEGKRDGHGVLTQGLDMM
jgi:hypothetical protein